MEPSLALLKMETGGADGRRIDMALDNNTERSNSMGDVWAGLARTVITPPVESTWQAGYAARRHAAEGIHDDLVATALVLDDGSGEPGRRIALIAVDIITLRDEQVQRIRGLLAEQGAVQPERVLICSSHTHGGPAVLQRATLPSNAEYIGALEQHLAGLVAAAARRLTPVAIGLGFSEARFNVNRRLAQPDGQMVMRPNAQGIVDRSVTVLRLDTLSGGHPTPGAAPLALLFRYVCHPTSMGAQNYQFTADYPGAARRFVERAYADSTKALFLPGCFANIRPNLTNDEGAFRSATWEEVEALGRQLGSSVVQAAEAVCDPTAPPATNLGGVLGAALERLDLPIETNDGGVTGWPAEVQVLRCGETYIVGLPGEIFLETGLKAQQAVARASGVEPARVLVLGYCNGSIGYLPTASAIPEGGYEVGAWRNSERPGGFTADAERRLVECAARQAARLAVMSAR